MKKKLIVFALMSLCLNWFYIPAIFSQTHSEVVKQGCMNIGNGELLIFIHGHSLDHRMWDE